MTQVTWGLTAKNRDQLRNPTLRYRAWATFLVYRTTCSDPPCTSAGVRHLISNSWQSLHTHGFHAVISCRQRRRFRGPKLGKKDSTRLPTFAPARFGPHRVRFSKQPVCTAAGNEIRHPDPKQIQATQTNEHKSAERDTCRQWRI